MVNKALKVLVTCPPMLGALAELKGELENTNWQISAPKVTQTLSEQELMGLLPDHDGWIIGDDPATQAVVEAGRQGRFKAAVKWGVGTDNVDFTAFEKYGIPVENTPGMFGDEVADIALGYLIGLARQTYQIHTGILQGEWLKPAGTSLRGRVCAVVGYGDIGRQLASRLEACGLQVLVYDPAIKDDHRLRQWPQNLEICDFICFTCALNEHNRHMLSAEVFNSHCKPGVKVVNVARGPLIDEQALVQALSSGRVAAAALDVFEVEPLPMNSELRRFPQNIYGSHNSSNTKEAVIATSQRAIDLLQRKLAVYSGS